MRSFLLFAVLGVTAACTGTTATTSPPDGSTQPTPNAQVSGTIGGEPIPLADAIGSEWTFSTSGGSQLGVELDTTNRPSFCALLQAETGESNVEVFSVGVESGAPYDSTPTPVVPGTYMVPVGTGPSAVPAAEASLWHTDATCHVASGSSVATSGSVTFDVITASRISGSFDLYFGQDHVTGTFDAPVCNDPADIETQLNNVPGCQ
jgi:hypothetical protein